jgi:acyl-CoA dehydrogenase
MSGIEMTEERRQIRDAVKAICDRFDDDYWLGLDNRHEFPHAYRDEMAKAGWFGIAMPEQYGGAGLGIAEAALVMHTAGNSDPYQRVRSPSDRCPRERGAA